MVDTYPNPWAFGNTDKQLLSADNLHKIVYGDLNEIAIGSPIGGECFLETTDKQRIKIHDWCGGPPTWETKGQLLAIPIWTRTFLKGTVQKIGVVDTTTKELKIFAKTFRVLHLRVYDKNVISGYDSPIHKPTTITFDIAKERVETTIKLTD
jgi:hypothetical protein